MTTYEALPNTDGQILIPVGKKPAVVPQRKFPRTVPPPRRPPGTGAPAPKFGVQARPQSPPIHRPVRRSTVRSAIQPEASRPQQSRASNNNLRKRLEIREAADRQWTAVNSSTSDVQVPSSHIPNYKFRGCRPESVITKDEIPLKMEDQVNADRMSLSYIMGNQLGAPKLRPIPEEKERNLIDLIVSFEKDGENSENEDENEEIPLVHRNEVHTRYPPFPTHNRPNIHKNPNAKYLLNNPGITASLQDSVLNMPVELEGIERGRNSGFGESGGTAKMAPSRANCRLPSISTIGATHFQSHPDMKAPSPFTSPHLNSRSASSSGLNTLEHAAVTTLASFKSTLDSNKLNSSTAYCSGLSPNQSWPSKESLQTPNLKRLSSLISTPTPTLKQLAESKSQAPPPLTGLEPATKRSRISSLLNPASSHLSPASTTPLIQPTNILHTKTPIHHPNELSSNPGNSKLTAPPSSSGYPSPPVSPSYSLPQPPLSSNPSLTLGTFHRALIPRTAHPNIQPPTQAQAPSINPQSHSHLLFFNNQTYSPLPLPSPASLPLPRSSSAPLLSTHTSQSQSKSTSPTPHPHSPTHKNFAYRAWKLRPSHSILTNPPPSQAPQYLIMIRHDDRSKTPHTHDSNSSNTDTLESMGRWWSVLNGREEIEEIRKIFE